MINNEVEGTWDFTHFNNVTLRCTHRSPRVFRNTVFVLEPAALDCGLQI